MAAMAAILDIRKEKIFPILTIHVATMPPTEVQLYLTYGSGGDVENVKSQGQMTDRRTTGMV